ncbi:uncharacterized protein OCT59_008370 [Rhizophagus irregularis]|nr:hypothetical protein OCT59_008370 [Rhizophagus irregularis]
MSFQNKDLKRWTSGNVKIDSFIQERQLKINEYKGAVFEWIPYDQFNEIKETGKNYPITVYSAIWKNGPLNTKKFNTKDSNKEVALKCLHSWRNPVDSLINEAKKYLTKNNNILVLHGISRNPDTGNYILVQTMWKDGPLYKKYRYHYYRRDLNKEVVLKCLHNLQDPVDSLINEVKKYSTKNEFLVLYGISQNPDTSDYILVQNYLIRTSGNEKIDDFIQERKLEWIPYNQFNEIKEIGKNGSMTAYSAIWKNGPLYKYNGKYTRDSNKEVALKCLHNLQNPIDSLINEAKKYLTKNNSILALYGISRNPDTGDYILVQKAGKNDFITAYSAIWRNGPLNKYNGKYTRDSNKEVALKYLHNLQNPVDSLIKEAKKYSTKNNNLLVLYGISRNPDTGDYILVQKVGRNSSITAIWKDGPLYKKCNFDHDYRRDSNKEVVLKCLHNLQNPFDSLINEAKKYSVKNKFLVLYGISQNPDTSDYILVQNSCINLANQISRNKKIDDFIKKSRLNINSYDDVVFEWIPYNQFTKIKEIGKNGSTTAYSTIWKNGPLQYDYARNTRKFRRYPNKKVVFKCVHNLQNHVDSIINEAKKYSTKNNKLLVLYGISQNPDTSDYIFVENNHYIWKSGNERIDDFIQKRQLNVNSYNDVVFEWIPYDQFNKIKEVGRNSSITVYSAIWKTGPLHMMGSSYTRESSKKVVLKYLHNLQNLVDSLINEAKKYSTKNNKFLVLYGISQNPDTIFEWIPYNQFNEIKEVGRNGSITAYSAIWSNGPLYKINKWSSYYTRDSNKKITLKCLHKLQNPVDYLTNEAKNYSTTNNDNLLVLYGISQNPDTKDYILVLNNENYCSMCDEIYTDIQYKWCKLCNFLYWKSGDNKIDSLIQLKINKPSDTRFKWIPYNQFNKIRNIGKGHFFTVYSAIWNHEEVALVCFNDSQKFLNKVKEYDNSFKMYGISQNLKKKDYILVLENEYCTEYGKTYCKNCGEKYGHVDHTWCRQCLITATSINSRNEKIDDLIQEMQLKINSPFNIIFEWIPYDQFNYIKAIGKGGFATVYSAIWKDGPIKYDVDEEMCTRVSNKKVALKCLNNSQNMIDKFLSEVREYSINKMDDILNVYGVSQNPNTNDYIIVIEYADGGSYNNWIDINYKDFDWGNKIQTLLSIIEGLKGIHKNQKVHHDFHTGNILFLTKNLNNLNRKSLFISDMGLCENVNNTSEVKTYGVIPYMAPEVLRGMPYTKAADIYSFGDSNATEIRKQFKEAEIYRKSLPSLKKNKQHPEAIYTSRLLDPFTKDLPKYDNSECISCAIIAD